MAGGFETTVVREEFLPRVRYEVVAANDYGCEIRVALRNETDASDWLRSFEHLSNTQWVPLPKRTISTDAGHRQQYVLDQHFLCRHGAMRKVDQL